MPLSKWRKLTQKELFKNPWWVYRQDTFSLPNGEVGDYFYVHTNGSSIILPVLDDGRLVMVKQYRYLRDDVSLEFPCGGVKAGSDYLISASQELQEEAGYAADEMVQVGEFNPYNGVTNEMCRVYVARGLKLVGINPDPTEEFEHFTLTPDEIDKRILSGEIWDGMSIAAWFIGRQKIM